MKKAFTMIELIFVIVILGILAAVAIPRLNATRDDAEFVKAKNNFNTMLADVTSYYTSHGKFPKQADIKLNEITSAPIYLNEKTKTPPTHHGWFTVKDVGQCLYVKVGMNSSGIGYLQLRGASGINPNSICARLIEDVNNAGIISSNSYTADNFTTRKTDLDSSNIFIKLGGSGVAW